MTWQLASTVVVLAALAAGAAWWERRHPPSKLLALAAALAALAVAGRVLFAPIPNVQATTDIVLLSGYCLGAGPGFAVGALGALGSNFFLGQGPWTPWQMLGWGGVGIAGAGLARALAPRSGAALLDTLFRRWLVAVACALAGLAFGAWMDLFTLVTFAAESSSDTYLAIAATSLPFNVAHAIGNMLLCLLLGPGFVRLLLRFRRRFEIRWAPARPRSRGAGRSAGTAAIGVLLAAVGGGALAVADSEAASGPRAAVRYLERAQNRDGGFGAAPGEASSQLMTGWTVIGLEAAGRNPLDLRRARRTPIGFMRAHARTLSDTGELERTILALRAAKLGVRRFAGRDLVAELLRRRRANGSFQGQVNLTAFGLLALRAAGRSPRSQVLRRAAAWIVREQNGDGGFSFSGRGGASDVDDTGAVLQALGVRGGGRAAARRDAVERAIRYLRKSQNVDGGLGQMTGSRSNAQSTAWAIQGLVAAGHDPERLRRGGRSPLAYLRSLQAGDGSFRYSRTSAQTPVWVTATALAGVLRRPLPLAAVERRRGETRSARRPAGGRRNASAAGKVATSAGRDGSPAADGRRSAPNAIVAPGVTRPAAYPASAVEAERRDEAGPTRFPKLAVVPAAAGTGLLALLLYRRRARRG